MQQSTAGSQLLVLEEMLNSDKYFTTVADKGLLSRITLFHSAEPSCKISLRNRWQMTGWEEELK